MAATLLVGESLVGEGNEVAHVDLLIGSKSGPVGEAFANVPRQPEGGSHEPARGGGAQPPRQARHDHVQQGHDQGRDPGGADVRARPGGRGPRRRRLGPRGRHHRGRRRRPLHHRRRLHPLGSHGRQEDLRLQLPGHQGGDRARPRQRAERERRSSVRRRRRATRSRRAWRASRPRRTHRRTGPTGPAGRPARRRDRREQRDRARHRRGVCRRGSRGAAHAPRLARARARGRRRDRGARRARARPPGRSRDARRAASAWSPRRASELGRLDVWVNNAGADVLTGEAADVGVGAQARHAAGRRPQGHDRLLVRGRRGHARPGARRRRSST